MSIDRISNMVSAIKNAALARKESVIIPHTALCSEVAKVLFETGFLSEVKTYKEKGQSYKMLRLDIAYNQDGSAKLTDIRRVSKPGKRVYTGSSLLGGVAGGHGVAVVSTSRGVTTGLDAKNRKLGGEVILKAW